MRKIMLVSTLLVVVAAIVGFAMRDTIIDAVGNFVMSFTEREIPVGVISDLGPDVRELPIELPRDRRAWGIYLRHEERMDASYKDIHVDVSFENKSGNPLRIGVRDIGSNEVTYTELTEGEQVSIFQGPLSEFIGNMTRESRYRKDTIWSALLTVRSIEGKSIFSTLMIRASDEVDLKEDLLFYAYLPRDTI